MKKMKRAILASVLCAFLAILTVPANATLLVMPIWIVFKDRDRTANVTLINTSGSEAIYTVGWRYQKQKETGAYDISDKPLDPARDISKMIVFSPRQVSLPPRGKQRIRLSLRKPADLPNGEYRAHLLLVRMGNEADLPGAKSPIPKDKLRLGLMMNVGYSLPVILRQGQNNASASIAGMPKFIPAVVVGKKIRPAALEVSINRSGDFGTMGKLKILWTPPGQPEKQIGIMNNVNIFTEISHRIAPVPLTENAIPNGVIRIIYEGDGPDKGVLFDEKTFPIGE